MFRAYEPDTERVVAVKLFRLDLPPERAHLLAGEFDRLIASGLGHSSIAAPIATGITVTSAYLVQEFVAGESLDVAMRTRAAGSINEALRVAGQVAAGLDHAAAVEVTHGALHPRDVLVSGEDTWLTGVGIAKALERAGAVAPVRRPYAPPERAAGVGWDHRCDVFSLAALVYEMLWARRVAASGEQVTRALTELPGTDLGTLRRVFGRALASDPAERFESAGAFAEALRGACSDLSASLSEPLPFVRRDRRAKAATARTERPREPAEAAVAPLLPLDPPTETTEADDPGADGLVPIVDIEERPAHAAPPSPRSRAAVAAPAMPPAVGFAVPDQATVRSGLVPLALTGLVFLSVGFAAGYGVANWQPTPLAQPSPEPIPAVVSSTPVAEPLPPAAEAPVAAAEPVVPAVAPPAPPPERGRLVVRSTPAGARVLVDGRDRGRTPLTLASLSPGSYAIRVTRDGYLPIERRLTISASRPSQSLSLSLAAERPAAPPVTAPGGPGSVQVESRPGGARVYVNGRLAGRTPLQLHDVRVGVHAVSLELDGYRRWTSSVRVGAGERQRVAASLEPD